MNGQEVISLEAIKHYFNIEKYNRVIELAREVMSDHLGDGYIWYMVGYSNYAIDAFDVAEEQLLEAMRLGYNEEIVLYVLGHLYMETERWQEAEGNFLELLRLNPNNAETHVSYAYLMKKTGHRKKAKLLINKALELEPENAQVLRQHFILEGINGNREQQIIALEQYMNSADSELAKLIQLGLNATFRNDIKEARGYYRQAFLLKPEDKKLLSILDDIETAGHPLLAPNRLVYRIGGPAVFWIIGLGMFFLLQYFGYEKASQVWALCYILLSLYTWISEPLVKILRKIRG